jgi:hypothetical protein
MIMAAFETFPQVFKDSKHSTETDDLIISRLAWFIAVCMSSERQQRCGSLVPI